MKHTIKWVGGGEDTGDAYCFEHGEIEAERRGKWYGEPPGTCGSNVHRLYNGGNSCCTVCGVSLRNTHITVITPPRRNQSEISLASPAR